MNLAPHITADSFLQFSASPQGHILLDTALPDDTKRKQTPQLIYFITGNPGLISYYHTFLSLLSKSLCDRSEEKPPYIIYGASLFGFEIGTDKPTLTSTSASSLAPGTYAVLSQGPPYSLLAQVNLTFQRLQSMIGQIQGPVHVTLIGHSVGAYIALEVVRLYHANPSALGPPSRSPNDEKIGKTAEGTMKTSYSTTITSAILLTPTLMDLALSPWGRKATPLANYVPFLPQVAQSLARVLTFSRHVSNWLVSYLVRSPQAAEIMIALLESDHGVRQVM